MSYINANEILPKELIDEIQRYVQGVNLYIPKIFDKKRTDSEYKKELFERDMEIYEMFQSIKWLSRFLHCSISKIVQQQKLNINAKFNKKDKFDEKVSRPRQNKHLKRKNSIQILSFSRFHSLF